MGRWTRRVMGAVSLSLVLGACGVNPLENEAEVKGLVQFPTPAPTPVTLPTEVNPFDAESVTQWQMVLVQLGYDVTPDGVFGQQTLDATASLQTDLGLPATGVVDPATIFAVGLTWPPDASDADDGAESPELATEATPSPEPTSGDLGLPTPSGDAEIAIECVDTANAALPHRAEFLVSVENPGDGVEFGIDYGDASQYVTADWTDAQLNGYVHSYTSSGTYNVVVWVRWTDGANATARCQFDIRRGDAGDAETDAPDPDVGSDDSADGDTGDDAPADGSSAAPDELGEGELPTGPAGG